MERLLAWWKQSLRNKTCLYLKIHDLPTFLAWRIAKKSTPSTTGSKPISSFIMSIAKTSKHLYVRVGRNVIKQDFMWGLVAKDT